MGKQSKKKGKPAVKAAARAPKPAPAAASRKKDAKAPADGRRTGLRGAAPWAARHAAKHAAEARARNAAPPPPGSARATLRTPEAAEQIKVRVAELHNAMIKIRVLRKNLHDKFFELGLVLAKIKDGQLWEAKGYASFEAFVEREVDLGKSTSLRLERMPRIFHESAAREFGLDAVLAAIEQLETASGAKPTGNRPQAAPTLPLKPPSKR